MIVNIEERKSKLVAAIHKIFAMFAIIQFANLQNLDL